MANQNFRVKTGLEVGTGVTISAGIVTAVSFRGDGSALTGVAVTTNVRTNSLVVSGVSTLGNTVVGGGTTQLIVNGDARITGILTIGTSSITLDGSNNRIVLGTGTTISSTGAATFNNGLVVTGVITATTFNGVGDALINGLTIGISSGGIFDNTVIGYNALSSNTTGASNVAIGYSCLYSNIDGTSNTAIGVKALYLNTGASFHTAIGQEALYSGGGGSNVAIGYQTLYSNSTGYSNVAVGNGCLYTNLSGHSNVSIGHASLGSNDSGIRNVSIGYAALFSNTTSNYNTAIGFQAGYNATGSNNVLIGPSISLTGPTAQPPIPGGSNQLVIGAGNTAWIYGNNSYSIGIGTTNPPDRLTVLGRVQIQQDSGSNNRLILRGQPGSTYRWNIDNNGSSNDFRIFREDDTTTANGFVAVSISTTGNLSDAKGNVRAIPQNAQTSAYILAASDVGKHISITTGGVTINASIFSAGDAVTIYNNSGSNQTITQGTSVTLRSAGTADTGNRTLAQYGVCTVLCIVGGATPTFVISGAGLS